MLGGHVGGGADHLSGPSQRARLGESERETEVGDVGGALSIEQDVRRFEIAVEDASLVSVVDRPSHLRDDSGDRQRIIPETVRLRRQAPALQKRHGVVVPSLVSSDLMDRHDSRMAQACRRFRLGPESPNLIRCRQGLGEDHLERDGPVEANLPCPVDDAHPPSRNLLDELVVPEVADSLRRRGVRGPDGSRREGRSGLRTVSTHDPRGDLGEAPRESVQTFHAVEQRPELPGQLGRRVAAAFLYTPGGCGAEIPFPGPQRCGTAPATKPPSRAWRHVTSTQSNGGSGLTRRVGSFSENRSLTRKPRVASRKPRHRPKGGRREASPPVRIPVLRQPGEGSARRLPLWCNRRN